MRAFVIRGFGLKAGVDFERVHKELIGPALEQVGVDGGGTTGEIVEAGNIREDMFREIYLADIVVADISVHNANVFYELGIRHAMQPRSTVLIRAKIDEVPFDIQTDRYMSYDPKSPGTSLPQLTQVLRETLATERVDSPVYSLLPGLTPGPRASLLDLPRDLAEDIEQARQARQAGQLRLIADEVMGLRFEDAALRKVAAAMEEVGDNVGARKAWEKIRAARPGDFEANHALINVYRRLGDLVASDQAIERALGSGTLTSTYRAELYGLRGSYRKRRWIEHWHKAHPQDWGRLALRSGELRASLNFYRRGFDEDLNAWYPGLNALALTKITLELADRYPDDWRNRFETDDEADRELERLRSEADWLTSAMRACIDAARLRSRLADTVDFWIEVTAADLRFLTCNEPDRVVSAYEAAMSPALGSGARRSVREQVEIYRDLGVFVENAARTLKLLGPADEGTVGVHPLVFTGHIIDAPSRARPRFPADREGTAYDQIKQAIREFADSVASGKGQVKIVGMAGAADGGDLLFHEACAELGIDSEVFLPVPELTYRATAMSGRPGWVERYHAVLTRAKGEKGEGVHTLARTDTLPGWLQSKPGYSTWLRSNRWILNHAWATTTVDRVTVLALWDGETGDSPSLVADMVATAQAGGAEVRVLETGKIFGLPGPQPAQQAPAVAETVAAAPTVDDHEDKVLHAVWLRHRQWSKAAGTAQTNLNRWRLVNLILLVLGAVAAAFAAQTWLASAGTAALAAVSGALLAAAGIVQGTMLTAGNTSRWTGARAASEALKAETYRYLTKVKPYADADRAEQLQAQFDAIQTRAQPVLADLQLTDTDLGKLPAVDTFGHYLTRRAQDQATWHRTRIAEHLNKARTLRRFQLAATAAGAVLAAIAGALPGVHLAAWTAAATTIAAAFASHLAATQHQRIAASYAATADQLERLILGVDAQTASADRQAQFVADVERVLAAQNAGWVDLLGTAAKT